MSSIGPQLPPHLSKRKRGDDDDAAANGPNSPPSKVSRSNKDEITLYDNEGSDFEDCYGPSAPKTASIGPTMPPPPSKNAHEITVDADYDYDDKTGPAPPSSRNTAPRQPAPVLVPTSATPKRIMGPAPPPANLSERLPKPASKSDSDDDDDDYGPAIPGTSSHFKNSLGASSFPMSTIDSETEGGPPKRDDWMLAPPTATGYQERDPTKIKARKFASGSSATSRPAGGGDKSGAGGISSIWTETPEQKAKRLADAVLGRGSGGSDPTAQASVRSSSSSRNSRGDEKGDSHHQHDKIRTFTEQTRGKSLYEEHQAAKKAGKAMNSGGGKKGGQDAEEEDDDPSKRAFDREKDMGLGKKITASQRKELLNRASDFGGRFQKGNYL